MSNQRRQISRRRRHARKKRSRARELRALLAAPVLHLWWQPDAIPIRKLRRVVRRAASRAA